MHMRRVCACSKVIFGPSVTDYGSPLCSSGDLCFVQLVSLALGMKKNNTMLMMMIMGMMKNESKLFRIILELQRRIRTFSPKSTTQLVGWGRLEERLNGQMKSINLLGVAERQREIM